MNAVVEIILILAKSLFKQLYCLSVTVGRTLSKMAGSAAKFVSHMFGWSFNKNGSEMGE